MVSSLLNRSVTVFVIAFGLAVAGCNRTVAVGRFRVPQTSEVTLRASNQPDAAEISTKEKNELFVYARSKTDRDVASDLNIPAAIMGYTRLIPKEGVPWIRAYSHRRADGAQLAQIDYRQINESEEINASELISINRFIIFREHIVVIRGLLTKGDIAKDYSAIDRLLEHLAIRE